MSAEKLKEAIKAIGIYGQAIYMNTRYATFDTNTEANVARFALESAIAALTAQPVQPSNEEALRKADKAMGTCTFNYETTPMRHWFNVSQIEDARIAVRVALTSANEVKLSAQVDGDALTDQEVFDWASRHDLKGPLSELHAISSDARSIHLLRDAIAQPEHIFLNAAEELAEVERVRDAALEEAAKICDKSSLQPAIAKRIRALKSNTPQSDSQIVKDAARYQWIRNSGRIAPSCMGVGIALPMGVVESSNGEKLDAMIDAAMHPTEPAKEGKQS